MYRYGKSSNQTVFRAASAMSNQQIAQYAPSVLAEAPHESRGPRYAFIPTIQVLDAMRKEGFQPFEVRQTRVRDEGKREFTKHMVRLRHPTAIASGVADQEVPEIVLINSHDGTSAYQILAGYFRFICSNGLIAGDVCQDIRIRHSGNVVNDVIEGSYRVIDNIKEIDHRIDAYKGTILKPEEQLVLAESSMDLRYDRDANGNTLAPFQDPGKLLSQRHQERNPNTLWSTFNRIQESLVKGGIAGRSATGRRTRTREVGGVNENVKLNRALWTLADKMAQIKGTVKATEPEAVAA
jgi:hypothetical protein